MTTRSRLSFGVVGALLITGVGASGQEDYVTGTQVNALDAGHGLVFWKADCADPAFSTDRIHQVPPTGGLSSRPYYETGCSLTDRVFSKISRDADGNYYFLNGHGDIRRFNSNSGAIWTEGSADTPAAVPHNAPTAFSGTRVYFTEYVGGEFGGYSKLFQVATEITFTAPKLVVDLSTASEIDRVIRKILPHSRDRVTYHSGSIFRGRLGQAIRAERFEGGYLVPYWAHTTVSSDCTALTEYDDDIYWVDQSEDRTTSRFRRAPKTNPTSSTLLHTRTLTNPHAVMWFATDGDFLYYFDWIPSGSSTGTGSLMRKEIGGAGAVQIAGPFSNVYARDLCVQGDYLFWIETGTGSSSATKIRRLAVNAAAIQRDLRMSDLEVIQIVQDNDNGVPLIADKPTVVRAFPRLWYTSIGETEISSPAVNVILEGSRGGSPLPGSPLVAYQTGPILLNPTTRLDPDNRNFLFYLPPEWTEDGDTTLTARVNPGRAVQETSYTNNSISETVTFENRARVCVSVYPLRHTHGTLGTSYSPLYQSTLDRAEAVLPTPELIVSFEGGDPLEEYEWDEVAYGPYELSDSDDDSWKVLFRLNGRYVWNHMSPPYCSAVGFSAALFNTFPERAFNGISNWGSFICFLDTRYAGINNPQSGITWAHEMGHNFDRDHINCPDGEPANVDPGYPYPPCQFGDTDVHMGYDPLTREFFKWDEAGDLMSYSRPRWPSPYTWNGIRGEINLLSLAASAGEDRARAPGPMWYTGGIIYPDGSAEFAHTYAVDDTAAKIMQARMTGSENNNYEIRGYEEHGGLLFTEPAHLWQAHDAVGEGYVFSALLPPSPGAVRLVLAQVNPPKNICQMAAGKGAPTVHIIKPSEGDEVPAGVDLVVDWTASDPDKDPLVYQVRFSSDGGAHWKSIGDGLVDTLLAVDHAVLAGGPNCRVEVRASDGINSAVDISGTFALPESTPQAWMFFDTVTGRHSEWLATVYSPVGQEVTVRAKGYDAEDGPLQPPAFSWDVQGPDDYAGTGQVLRLHDLAPGTYDVELTAEDSSGASASTLSRLIVDPKHINHAGAPVTFDGRCLDLAYTGDRYPVSLRYDDAKVSRLYGIYSGGALYLCVANMPNGSYSLERLVLYLDVSDSVLRSSPSGPGADQYRLRVEPSGEMSLAQGNGTGYSTLGGYEGVETRVWRGAQTWTVEIRLPDSLTGGYAGQTIGVAFGHENRTSSTDDTYWPLSMSSLARGTWAPFVLGSYAEDPTDLDGDGLPDAWEDDMLKGTVFDANDDPDKDGLTNGAEWEAGTDPLDFYSRFEIVDVGYTNDGRVRIDWLSEEGRTYSIRRSDEAGGFLMPIVDGIPATPPANTHHDSAPPPDQAFFRIAVHYGR